MIRFAALPIVFLVSCASVPSVVACETGHQGGIASPAGVPGANIVANGSFESPVVASSAYDTYAGGQFLAGWAVSRGSVDHISGRFCQAAAGAQSLDLDGSCGDGTIVQDLVTEPGRVYRIRFAVAGNPDGAPSGKRLVVRWGATVLDTVTFDANGRSRRRMGWGYREYVRVADSSVTRLTFRSLTRGCYGPALDAVSVQPLTEPVTMLDSAP